MLGIIYLLTCWCCLSDLPPHIRPSCSVTCKYFLQVNEIFPSWTSPAQQHQHQILIIKHPVMLERSHRKFWSNMTLTPARLRLATNVLSGAGSLLIIYLLSESPLYLLLQLYDHIHSGPTTTTAVSLPFISVYWRERKCKTWQVYFYCVPTTT